MWIGGGGGEVSATFTSSSFSAAATTTDPFDYLSPSDIKPCDKPQREINRLANDLIQNDWPEIFHTLNIARQVAYHHKSELLQSNQLHSVILGVNKQVENLRSTAAKNAILALGDFYSCYRYTMDSEVPASSTVLIKVIFFF